MSDLLVDGFFPHCEPTDRPARQRASGFREIGLPFESDTAITRHLAAFLQAHGDEPGKPVRPTHVLFNGGVFKAEALQRRLLDVLGEWFGGGARRGCSKASTIWTTPSPAARRITAGPSTAAACAFAAARPGRITSASRRPGLAVPGAPRPLRALCVAPIGMEEGTETDVPSGEIGLVVGEPAHFRFFSSSVRKADRPGDVLTAWTPDELPETDSLEAVLPPDESIDEPYVPVRFHAKLTELGVLELWCVEHDEREALEAGVQRAGIVELHHREVILHRAVEILVGHLGRAIVVLAVVAHLQQQVAGMAESQRAAGGLEVLGDQVIDRLAPIGDAELLAHQLEQPAELVLGRVDRLRSCRGCAAGTPRRPVRAARDWSRTRRAGRRAPGSSCRWAG